MSRATGAGDYNVGNVKFLRANEKFAEEMIGEVTLPQAGVTPEELSSIFWT
jgi:hypothetical protein